VSKNPSTTSSTTAATPRTRSSTGPGKSVPQAIRYRSASSLGAASEATAPDNQFTRRLNSPKLQILTLQR
jgi:hypothetical protein